MCQQCISAGVSRRSFMRFAGAGLLSASAGFAGHALAGEDPPPSPDEALHRLVYGNKRFVQDAEAGAAGFIERRAEIAKVQKPWSIVLTCSDSRVVPELIFGGVTLGEMFVARNAGNVVDTDVLGTIEYGVEHLHVPLVVVMAHKRCGAVAAGCDAALKGTKPEGNIGHMIEGIVEIATKDRDRREGFPERVARAHALRGVKRIFLESAITAHLVRAGRVKVVPAYYDLDSGEVEFLDKSLPG
ncbi:carbonic anhydrase [Xaviernesmea oryzae]|uniref:carbonic anhydrase n=1 Tax=Xaviernesmea oryzae TaxID=464029 RepID=A0A1Q9AS23_9HYPH|nr:carbonic anhydrase [Xaviernesmea oryzae]OLP58095.1 carbonic anhydrase [Xaviernesmea oryzae]SEL82990.1 carbonic anhydrase [Xaviernesmea oryzae]